jgi:hypothetical protein
MARASKPSFNYQKRSRDDIKERANMRGGDFDSIILPKYKVFKPKDGKNLVRIMPPTWDDAKHYGYDVWVNYGIGVDNQSYLSLSKMKGEKDPLAEAKHVADKDGDKDLAKALRPRQRIGMWLVDRNAEDEGPQIWLAPFSVDKSLATLSYDEDTKEVIFIDDPEAGCDVRFYKEGQGLNTDYDPAKMKIMKASPLCEDEGLQTEWLEFIQEHPIPDCLQYYDYDHIATVFDGTARIDKDDDAKPAHKPAKPADDDEQASVPRGRRAPAPDPDDEEPATRPTRVSRGNVDPDDDPEPVPAPRSRTRVAPVDDDDEPTPVETAKPSLRERLRARRPTADED